MGPPIRNSQGWTIRAVLGAAGEVLSAKGVDSPRFTAELLLAHMLGVRRIDLYLDFERPLNDPERAAYRALLKRRLNREPLQYITGEQEFWSLRFEVGPAVLIPRPETELLVEQCLLRLTERPSDADPARILDLGTGSGALVVAIATEAPQAELWATDISPEALKLAAGNARSHGVAERIHFLQGDLWQPVQGLSFDVIVANPPYVAAETYADLPPEVRDHEPRAALDGGARGMRVLTRITADSPPFVKPRGWLILEIAPTQGEEVLRLTDHTAAYGTHDLLKDYAGLNRVVVAQRS